MSPLQSFRNLPPKTRIGVGLGLLAWGVIGLQLSDRAEDQYFKPTEEDRAQLRDLAPTIRTIDRVKDDTPTTTHSNSSG